MPLQSSAANWEAHSITRRYNLIPMKVRTSNALKAPPFSGPWLDFHSAIAPKFHIALALSILATKRRGNTDESDICLDIWCRSSAEWTFGRTRVLTAVDLSCWELDVNHGGCKPMVFVNSRFQRYRAGRMECEDHLHGRQFVRDLVRLPADKRDQHWTNLTYQSFKLGPTYSEKIMKSESRIVFFIWRDGVLQVVDDNVWISSKWFL